jgi:hypothetical protein
MEPAPPILSLLSIAGWGADQNNAQGGVMPEDNEEALLTIGEGDEFEAEDGTEEEIGSPFPTPSTPYRALAVAPGFGAYEKTLLKLSEWPEVKRNTGRKCKRVFGEKVCVNWPYILKRRCEIRVVARMSYPREIERPAKECFAGALTATVLKPVALGDYAGATATFKSLLEACLTARAADLASKVDVRIDTDKSCSDWHKI